jgi:probable F420-dependent oxidoreductase
MSVGTGTRWGITIPLAGISLRDHGSILEELTKVGYTDLWTAEGGQTDAVAPLAAAAAWVPSARLGTGVVSSFTRGPAVLASTAATMAQLAPGRFTLGVGSSSDIIVNRQNGLAFDRPLARTRDVVRFLKLALAGKKISQRFDTFEIDGYRLSQPPDSPPKILVAALRERMLGLAGAEADGAMLNWVSPADARELASIVRRSNPEAEIVARVMVCVTEDREEVRRIVKPIAMAYTSVGVYRAYHEWRGRGEALKESWSLVDSGDRRGAIEAIPDEVVDEMCVHGSADECRQRLLEYVDAGVSVPVLALVSANDDSAPNALALGPHDIP